MFANIYTFTNILPSYVMNASIIILSTLSSSLLCRKHDDDGDGDDSNSEITLSVHLQECVFCHEKIEYLHFSLNSVCCSFSHCIIYLLKTTQSAVLHVVEPRSKESEYYGFCLMSIRIWGVYRLDLKTKYSFSQMKT